MPITSIGRNFTGNPNIVFIETTDDLSTITSLNYLVTQYAVINELNNGPFEWYFTDMVLIYYSPNLINFFTHDSDTNSFVSLPIGAGVVTIDGPIEPGHLVQFGPSGSTIKSTNFITDDEGDLSGVNDLITSGNIIHNIGSPFDNQFAIVGNVPYAIFGSITNLNTDGGAHSIFDIVAEGGNAQLNFVQNGGIVALGIWPEANAGDNLFHLAVFNHFSATDPVIISEEEILFNVPYLTVSNSLSGQDCITLIQNLVTAPGSGCQLQLITTSNGAGTTGGSPSIAFIQTGFQNWIAGLYAVNDGGDNKFHLGPGSFSATNSLIIGSLEIDLNVQTVNVIHNNSGAPTSITIENIASSANSNAFLNIVTTSNGSGTTGGSPFISFVQNGYQSNQIGIWSQDNGGDNHLHFSLGAFSSGDPLIISGSGDPVTVNGNMTVTGGVKVGGSGRFYAVDNFTYTGGGSVQSVIVPGMLATDKLVVYQNSGSFTVNSLGQPGSGIFFFQPVVDPGSGSIFTFMASH